MLNTKRNWSNKRLDRELAFARTAKDPNHHENLSWLAECEAEANRRSAAHAHRWILLPGNTNMICTICQVFKD